MSNQNKINLVIDFNNIAMRSMFTCQYMGGGTVKNFDTEEECTLLIRKLATDMCQLVKMFNPYRVFVACDTKFPWRNELYKNMDGMKYKGSRKHDEEKNWTNIFNALSEYKTVLRNNNFVVTEIDHAEADDIAALWVDYALNHDESVVLVSSDKDWTQLVSFSSGKKFVACYNPISNNKNQKRFYVSQGFMDWINEPDVVDIFFNGYDETKKLMKDIVTANSKVVYEVIDPNRVVLDKILCGDDGDDVPAFYEYYKNGKKTRITPLKASHILENLSVSSVNGLNEAANSGSLREAVEKEMKTEVPVDFSERLLRQRKLVELDKTLFPNKIVEEFNSHVFFMEVYGVVNPNIKMNDLLKDTKFFDKNFNKPRENSIFDDVNALSKFSKAPSLF